MQRPVFLPVGHCIAEPPALALVVIVAVIFVCFVASLGGVVVRRRRHPQEERHEARSLFVSAKRFGAVERKLDLRDCGLVEAKFLRSPTAMALFWQHSLAV